MPFDPLKSYQEGLQGCRADPRADELFVDSIIRAGGDPDGGAVAHDWEIADGGRAKLTVLSAAIMEVFPDCFPGPAQLTGDCVARAAANCLLGSLAMEIYSSRPDEVTGKVEGAPELSAAGVRNGVVSSESLWAWRGYDRDGWVCSAAAQVATEKGFLVRKPYPDLKIDLTNYTESTLRIGGSRPPNAQWLAESKQHTARTATILRGREQVRDFLHAGYCVFNCSRLAFERTRDVNGVSKQAFGQWAHAQTWIGFDDRPETHQIYGQALVLWQNSWNKWNTGPRRVRGTDIEIPHGAYWALASTIDKCQAISLSSVAGWPRRKLPSFGAAGEV